ncbi:hypothetical protein AMTRI_Chr08g164420 [Amborella trichopoda]
MTPPRPVPPPPSYGKGIRWRSNGWVIGEYVYEAAATLVLVDGVGVSSWSNGSGSVQMIPMGRGYITLKFSKEEDMLNVWQGGPWKIEAFDRPVANNRRTRDKTFGHFARVQVDIDVTLDHKDLLIEREDLDTATVLECKRFGNSRARRALSDIVHSVKPEIIDVDEPKKFFGDLPISFLKSIGYTVDVIQNSRNISKPNLWILWKADIPKPNLLSTSDQQVTISCVAYAKYVVITVGHAGHTCAKRRELWLQFAAVAPNGPWCLVGDFNAILFSYEKSGCGPSNQRSMEEFAAMVSTSNLIASASRLVCAKLDRAFANDAWFEEFSKCATKALPRFSFDHSPLLIHSEVIPKLSNIPFKLFRFWMDHDQFLTEVQKTWNEGINGFAIFRIFHKLRRLKVVLKKWAKLVFGNLNSKVSKAKTELEDIHELMENVGFIQQILNDEK